MDHWSHGKSHVTLYPTYLTSKWIWFIKNLPIWQEEIPIRMSATGFGSTTPVTVIDLFKTTLSKHANEPAMGLKRAATMVSSSFVFRLPSSFPRRTRTRTHHIHIHIQIHIHIHIPELDLNLKFKFFLHIDWYQDGPVPETWKMWTWQDYYNDCMKFAQALISLNVDKYKIITILGFNSVRISFFQLTAFIWIRWAWLA